MTVIIRNFGICDYQGTYQDMVDFTAQRDVNTSDEIWFLQHPPVYTLGMAGKTGHVLNPGNIPVVRTDRGGQVTYHGPGQLLGYILMDLKRNKTGIKSLVHRIEQSIIDLLADMGIYGARKDKAPGVYIDKKKIAALGVRIRNNCSYHGFCLNVNMDLAPYGGINPCGYEGLEIAQLKDYGIELDVNQVATEILPFLLTNLGYDPADIRLINAPGHRQYRQPA